MRRRPPAGLTRVRISSWGAEPVRSRVGLPLGTDVLRQTAPADQNRFNSVDDTSNFISAAVRGIAFAATFAGACLEDAQRQVAHLAERSHRAELTKQMELRRSLKRGRTLGLGM
jgi:hypothetical protein